WLEKAGKFKVEYLCEGENRESNNDKDLIIFRIVQETINNIIKHSRAKRIVIRLVREPENLMLSISDNGVGFDPDSLGNGGWGLGLQNIKKRAALIGGDAQISSKPQKGTQVSMSIPYP